MLSRFLLSYFIVFSYLGIEEDNVLLKRKRDMLFEYAGEEEPKSVGLGTFLVSLPMEDDKIDYSLYIPVECWGKVFSHLDNVLYGIANGYFRVEINLRGVCQLFCKTVSNRITKLTIHINKLRHLGGLECFPSSMIHERFPNLFVLDLGEFKFFPNKPTIPKLNPDNEFYDRVPDETDPCIEAKTVMNHLFSMF